MAFTIHFPQHTNNDPPFPPPTHTQMQSSDDERPTLQELMEQVVMQLVKHLSSTVSHLLSQQNVPPLTSLIPSPLPQLSSLTVRIKRRGLVKIIMHVMYATVYVTHAS